MKLEQWEEALKGWQDFHTQILIDEEKTRFYIESLKEKIEEIKNISEVKNGE